MITNASPLIIFAKIRKLELLQAVTKEIIAPHAVYEEVVLKGKDAPDALLLKEFIEKKKIIVKVLNKEGKEKAEQLEKTYKNIDYGEAETIALALEQKESIVLIDEKNARDVAKLHGLIPKGSLSILLRAFQRKQIDEKELREIVLLMTTTKFHLGADVMNTFWMIVEKMKNY